MLSGLALLGVVALGVVVLVAGGASLADRLDGGGSAPAPTGSVEGQLLSGAVSGTTLAQTATEVLERDGADVTKITCPATARVDTGLSTVCHGEVDGEDWAVIVFFEDSRGRFTLLMS